MSDPRDYEATIFLVEGLLAVNPTRPSWTTVAVWAVEGVKYLPFTPHRLNAYRFGQFWTDCIAWDDENVARQQFALLQGFVQTYNLRLVKKEIKQTFTVLT